MWATIEEAMRLLPGERFEYSAIVDRVSLRLPGDARVVVSTVVNVDNWAFDQPMPRQAMTTPAGARALPDVPNWAWHEYGTRVGFWRLKAALDGFGIKATASINASVCPDYSGVARAVLDAGWEFMGHGFEQKAIATIRDFTGKAPRGWLGPGLTETDHTLDILAEEGIEYICDWVMDEQPVEMRTTAGPVVMVSYSVELNEIAIMLIQHHEARVLALCVHPYTIGVPHRIDQFERIFEDLTKRPGVLFWTNEQILDRYRGLEGES